MSFGWAGLIGSALDYIGGRDNASRGPRLAGRTAYQENYQGLLGRLEGAKAMGIHPSLALGSNIGGSGAPSMVGSDFRGAFQDAANEATRQREWKQEQDFRKAQESNNKERQNAEQRLNEAQIQHIDKQNQFIDEQIKASQEQRIREANRSVRSTASGAHDMVSDLSGNAGRLRVDNVGKNVAYVPNQVTRSVAGTAQGVNPGYELVRINGKVVKVPFGSTANHEPSELYQTYRDLEAAFQPGGIFGKSRRYLPFFPEYYKPMRQTWKMIKSGVRTIKRWSQ